MDTGCFLLRCLPLQVNMCDRHTKAMFTLVLKGLPVFYFLLSLHQCLVFFVLTVYPIFLISINVTRNLKVEGSTELFVRKLSSKLFNILKTTCMEFQDLFEGPESQSG